MRFTYIGGPTALLEIGGVRLLTDPTFDPPGGHYRFGWGTGSRKTEGPALTASDVGELNAVLLSHDQHADNLDDAGRAMLGSAGVVLTTPAAARRLDANSVGLAPWESKTLRANGTEVTVTAVPGRHGVPFSRPFVGAVTGFVLESEALDGAVYLTGDTVLFPGVAAVGRRFEITTLVTFLGGVRFPLTGSVRYTMNARAAARLIRQVDPKRVVPLHFAGWTHFREDKTAADLEFRAAGVADRVSWPEPGIALEA